MLDYPQTKEEARAYRYNQWAGNPQGRKFDPSTCAGKVWKRFLSYQCSRKPGHGPDKLYCKQHAKRAERKEAER